MCICSTIGKHILAKNRHEIECFLLQLSSKQRASELVSCTVQRFHLSLNIIIADTLRYSTWSEHCACTPFRNIRLSRLFIFSGQKDNAKCRESTKMKNLNEVTVVMRLVFLKVLNSLLFCLIRKQNKEQTDQRAPIKIFSTQRFLAND